jgi:predicted TIM-barrel fold metal-dependent hydrolase
VRGVRINALAARSRRARDLENEIAAAADQVQPLGWHVELALTAEMLIDLAPCLRRLAAPVVIGHMGCVTAPGRPHAAPRILVDLLARTRHWVKLSGADRTAPTAGGWKDVATVVRDLVAGAPDRLVWGSDWPHTAMHAGEPVVDAPLRPFREVDTGLLLRALGDWLADDTARRRVLVDNPARLYGFDAPRP